jgi:uncharacterized SAM-dependent methyltransferase
MNEEFTLDILEGLTSHPKYLSSKYFYDEKGNEILQNILELDEYYVTDCEMEILSRYKNELLDLFSEGFTEDFQLVELGAGDGFKTKILLNEFVKNNQNFIYSPIVLSEGAINNQKKALNKFKALFNPPTFL